jgi:Transposase IS200 like
VDNKVKATSVDRRSGDEVTGPDRDVCRQHEVQIMKGHVSKDHVHLLVSIPPQVTISRLLQWLKLKPKTHQCAGALAERACGALD